MPWLGEPRSPEAEESLGALLARRGEVRSRQTGPMVQASPDLFRPEKAVSEPLPGLEPAGEQQPSAETEQSGPAASEAPKGENTTSRLLEAKRRAQKRRE